MSRTETPTKSQLLLDASANALSGAGREMHFTELANIVYSELGFEDEPPARLNGVLHDDSSGRFRRTGRGLWALARWTPPTGLD